VFSANNFEFGSKLVIFSTSYRLNPTRATRDIFYPRYSRSPGWYDRQATLKSLSAFI